jgi:hypothetical protein
MTVRIAVSFLAIFAASLIAAPVKTLAGGGFTGAHAMAFQGGIGLPIGRPAIAHIQGERFANFPNRRRFVGRGAPAPEVWGVAPWYDGYSSTYDDYSSGDAAPDEQQPQRPPNLMTMESPLRPPDPGCTAQSYEVPSEAGGERSVKVVRCF